MVFQHLLKRKIFWSIIGLIWICAFGKPAYSESVSKLCAVFVKETQLKSENGQNLSVIKPFSACELINTSNENLFVICHQNGNKIKGFALAENAVLVRGHRFEHLKRLAKIKKAPLSFTQKKRLAKGIIKENDTFPLVEMAWGKPQRSFMVNFFSDEQHYVYFKPWGKVLLRFKGGLLSPPLPEIPPIKKP